MPYRPMAAVKLAENDVGNRRTAWRIIASVKPEDEQKATYARKYVMKVEAGLQKISDGSLTLMDKDLVPSATTGKMKLLCTEMKGCLAEFAGRDTKSEALQDADEARKMARVALDVEAIQLAPQEQIQCCTVEGIFKVPVSQAMEEIAEANTVKIGGKDELENHRLMMLKATEGKLKIKFVARKDEFEAEQDIPVEHLEQTSTLQADTQKAVARRQHKRNTHQQLARQVVHEKMGEGEKKESEKGETEREEREKEGRDGVRGVRAKEGEEEAGEQEGRMLGSLIKT